MNKKLITRKTKLGKIVEDYPQLAQRLVEKYQLYCVSCFAASFETLEEGAKAHLMTDQEIDLMIKDLNQLDQRSSAKKKTIKKSHQRL